MKKIAREVPLDRIAGSLPLYIYFDKYEFSALTGVSVISSLQRLRALVNDGLLVRKVSPGKKSYWKMDYAAKQEMLRKAIENKNKRGCNQYVKRGRKVSYIDYVVDVDQAESMAHLQHCELILKSAKFI